MREPSLIALITSTAVLIRGFFPEVGLVYTGAMAILGSIFLLEMLFCRF